MMKQPPLRYDQAIRLVFFLVTGLVMLSAQNSLAQKSSDKKTASTTVKQGICGTVIEKKGNFMPSPGQQTPNGQPVVREVVIFPVLNNTKVTSTPGGFIESTNGVKPVKTVKSNKKGRFCVSLPVGQYSVLIREPKGLYANIYDGQNNINPITVEKNRLSQTSLEITHQAAF